MRLKFLVCEAARPLIRLLPGGRVRALGWLGGARQDDESWQAVPRRYRVFYDRDLRAWVRVDLSEWGGRWYYFTGRYYDPFQQGLLRQVLRPGDSFIDVGANLGIHTMLAARLVGSGGGVFAFEPDPRAGAILRAHLAINGLDQVRTFAMGLGDASGELDLYGHGDHTGWSSFLDAGGGEVQAKVPVRRADDVLAEVPLPGHVLVKIDTEGFEHRVLAGMGRLLEREDVACTIEVTDRWLRADGSSADALIGRMRERGFEAYVGDAPRLGRRVRFRPLDGDVGEQRDVLFVKEPFRRRLGVA